MRDRVTFGLLAVCLAFGVSAAASAVEVPVAPAAANATPVSASDAGASTLDERVNQLASELRCLVCQNQTVADSHAPLAVQLKQEVRRQLAAGASADEVRDFMVQRYGDFVLYRPPVKAGTLALWVGPAVILLSGLVGLALVLRKRRLLANEPNDDADENDLPRIEGNSHGRHPRGNNDNNEATGQPAQADGRRTA